MVILHIVAPAEVGGLERVVHGLACGLRGAGHELHVAAVLTGPGLNPSFLTPLAAADVQTHPLVVPVRAYLRERRAIAELCHRVRPDVVHTHGYRPDVVDAGVARGQGLPTVTTVHGFTGGGWKNRLYERLQCRAFRRFAAVVAVSRSIVERLRRNGVPAERIHVVPNAWRETVPPLDRDAARRALGIPVHRTAVGWVGRLSYEKGPDVLLEALPQLSDLPLVVSVVGDGIERVSLDARAKELGLDGVLLWHGAIPDAGRLFRAFDVFVLSSRTEGTPIVVFEAMAAEVPVVATRVGGLPDMLSSAEAALVPADDPGALAAAIRAVYRHPAAARERAHRARERLQNQFSVEPWIERYDAVYRLVAGKAAPASPP